MCAYSVFNTFPVYPLSAKPLILLAFCRYRYHTSLFNRPGFTAMIKEVEAGNVGTVIVKDMSRFGRNYLQVGMYTEIKFPNKGVRFIAINNSVDSANPISNDFTPFLNIMNEWYAKDTSNKIKSVFKARMKDGMRCSGSIPYGYYRKPGDKQTLYVDEEAAQTVRSIFQMAGDGRNMRDIAETLRSRQILIPTAYNEKHNPENARNHSYHDPYLWTTTTVSYILDRQEYLGHTVLGKTICDNFKTKKRRKAEPDELMLFPNTHEAIIGQDIWDRAQRMRKRSPKKLPSGTYSHRLSGLVYCADCGARMSYSSPEAKHTVHDYDSNSSFQCSKYKNIYETCTSHFIKTSVLESAVLETIQHVSGYALENEEEFIEQLKSQWDTQQKEISDEEKIELSNAKKRVAELNDLIRGLYESNMSGRLPDRQYERLLSVYDTEQIQLEARIGELETQKTDAPKAADHARFLDLVRRYEKITELTDEMLYEFIDRIEVHAATGGRTRYRQQKIDIYFSFIGNYLPSLPELTEEERIAALDAEVKRRQEARIQKAAISTTERRRALREAAKTDPVAAEKYRALLERQRIYNARRRDKLNAIRSGEAYLMQLTDEERAKAEAMLAREAERLHRQTEVQKEKRNRLIEEAKVDPQAARQLAELRAKEKAARERKKEKQQKNREELSPWESPIRKTETISSPTLT